MPNINLIAQKRQEKARLERLVRQLFLLCSGLCIAGIVLFAVLSAQWFRLRSQVYDLKDQLAALDPKINTIKTYETRIADLSPKINLYGEAREHTMRWYTYLQIVARSMPDNTWLTRIYPAQAPAPQPGVAAPDAVVNLAGVTMSQQLVGETMLGLSNYQSLLTAVDLHYTQKGNVGAIPTVEFEVATNIKGLPSIFQDSATIKSVEGANQGGANANQAKS